MHTNLTSLLRTIQGPSVDNLWYVPFPVRVTQTLTLYNSVMPIPEQLILGLILATYKHSKLSVET